MSEVLNSLLLTDVAFVTQKRPSAGITSSHGSPAVRSNSSSNDSAVNSPIFQRIRSAVLRKMLALAKALSSPRNVTRPSSTFEISYPRFRISFFKTASRPKWHGATSSYMLMRQLLRKIRKKGIAPGDPPVSVREKIRTPDTLVRSQVLYPAELHAHVLTTRAIVPFP